ALHRQVIHEIPYVLRKLLVVETLFQRQRLILEVGEQLTIVLVAPGQFPAPVSGRELACRTIQIASEITGSSRPSVRIFLIACKNVRCSRSSAAWRSILLWWNTCSKGRRYLR